MGVRTVTREACEADRWGCTCVLAFFMPTTRPDAGKFKPKYSLSPRPMLRSFSDLFSYVLSARKLRRPVSCAEFSTVDVISSDYSNLLYHIFLGEYSFSFGAQYQCDTLISVPFFCEFTTLYYRGECTAPVFSCRGLQAGKILPAFPLLALPLFFFNTIFFIITGGRSRRAFARMIPDSVRARARAYRPPFILSNRLPL